jgi:hypothetical protein
MTSQQKYLFISDWQDPRIADEVYESDDDHLRENDDVDFYRLMVRGETVGYFPPMTAVHVQRGIYGSVLHEYYLPPRKYWEELEYRYNKMLPAEMVYHMQKDITELARNFHLEVLNPDIIEKPIDWMRERRPNAGERQRIQEDYTDQRGSWEILDIAHRERDWWHKYDEGPTSVLPAGCVWRMPAPRLPEKRVAASLLNNADDVGLKP